MITDLLANRVTKLRAYVIGRTSSKHGKLVLSLLLNNGADPATLKPAANTSPQPIVQSLGRTSGQNSRSKPSYKATAPKRRQRSVQIARLYPDDLPEPLRQARALIDLIREECPDFVGLYVPKSDLERTYRELCAAESRETHHWTAIARQLGSLTKKREVKRGGSSIYRLPNSIASVPLAFSNTFLRNAVTD